MRARVFYLIESIRRRLSRGGTLVRWFEPVTRALLIERGLTRPTLTFVRRVGLSVCDGPFEGLRYPRSQAAQIPGLASKLAGTYEAELDPAVEQLIAWEPDLVVNIGAGDGLYAVGMARRCHGVDVIAYELDAYARGVCNAVARHNGVDSAINLRGACEVEDLGRIEPGTRTVVLCDCEGAERELIDPQSVPWLRRAALLIEVHESFHPGLEDLLRQRLAESHTLELIEPTRRYLEDHPVFWEVPGLSLVQQEALMSELRPWRTPWLLAIPRAD